MILAASLVGTAPAAGEMPTAALAAQSRARAMAAELVRGVIDGQLRLLEENGLGDRPIHADIAALRGSIDMLSAREMQAVIDTLGRAEEAAPADRARLLAEARQQARGIVTRLTAERQLILRRLREAALAAQARAVLDRQRRVLAATDGLPTLADGSREQTMLATIEEQRNVNTMFGGLTAALEDVSNWEGDVAAVGLAGLRTLREAGVAAAVASAEQRLAAADPAAAAAAQRRAIEGLEAVIATVEGKRVARPDAVTAGRDAAALGERAMAMRAEMAKVPLTDESVEKLLAEQSALQESLAALAEQVSGVAAVAPLVKQAQEAAVETSANLLEGDQRQAVANHDTLIATLVEAAARLEGAELANKADASAEEFAARAGELAEVVKAVQALARQQEEIGNAAPANPAAAAAAEQQLAAAVARLQETNDLPAAVEERLALAADAAVAATQALAAPPQAQSQAAAETALRAATDALAAVARETAAALADAQRAALAAKVGELSRAAEVAERAAAAERGIAEAAAQFAQQTTADLPDDQTTGQPPRMAAAELANRQTDVAAVAAKVNEAVDGLAPEAAKMVDAARAAMAAARAELEARVAREHGMGAVDGKQAPADQPPADQPAGNTTAESTPPGDQTAARSPADVQAAAVQAAQHADQAATALAQAAATMRDEAKQGTNAVDLARAAQMAERAAAAERSLAEAARDLAAKPAAAADASAAAEIAAEAAQNLVARQAEISATADRIAAAADAMQSQAEPLLDAALAAMAEAREQLDPTVAVGKPAGQAAGEQASAAEAMAEHVASAKEAASAKQAAETAAADTLAGEKVARDAARAADALAQAAGAMRQEAKKAAEELAQAAAEQAAEAARARQDAEQQIAAQPAASPPSAAATPPPGGQPQPPASAPLKQLERQAAALAARETALTRDEALAKEMAAALADQADAREAIREEAERLAQPPLNGTREPDQDTAADALATAKDRFAEAQRAVGEGVAAALKQQEIGNKPLREALRSASRSDDLGTGFVPKRAETTADMIAGDNATAAAEQALAADEGSEPSEAGGFQPDQPNADDSASQTSNEGQPGQGQPGQEQSAQEQPGEPPDASQQARGEGTGEQAGDMSPSDHQASRDEDRGQGDHNTQGEAPSSQQAKNDDSQSRGSRTGEARDDSPLRQVEAVDKRADAGSRSGDVESPEKSFERDAWFARLPPEVRKAIRAGGQRRAPRGYEQKMDRYFKTVE